MWQLDVIGAVRNQSSPFGCSFFAPSVDSSPGRGLASLLPDGGSGVGHGFVIDAADVFLASEMHRLERAEHGAVEAPIVHLLVGVVAAMYEFKIVRHGGAVWPGIRSSIHNPLKLLQYVN
jgi:hypothetical protein